MIQLLVHKLHIENPMVVETPASNITHDCSWTLEYVLSIMDLTSHLSYQCFYTNSYCFFYANMGTKKNMTRKGWLIIRGGQDFWNGENGSRSQKK